MVTRIRRAGVDKNVGCPEVGCVAGIAFTGTHEMPVVLARRRNPIMALGAGSRRHVCMIELRRQPGDCHMTVIALPIRGYVVLVLACCGYAIMTL